VGRFVFKSKRFCISSSERKRKILSGGVSGRTEEKEKLAEKRTVQRLARNRRVACRRGADRPGGLLRKK